MMLNDSILILILGFLILSVALNFWLTFRLMRTVRRLPIGSQETATPLTPGTVVADLAFHRMIDQQPVALSTYPDHAKVLVFVGSKCPKCKAKLPELRDAVAKTHDLGVLIWILSVEKPRHIKNFLHDPVLVNVAHRSSKDTHDYLNPQRTYPYYIFLDAENSIQAEGTLGDENWSNFIEQIEQGG